MNASDFCIITTTTDSKENADTITQRLLEKNLVACVQSSTIQSTYRWEGKIVHSEEILLQIKTKRALFQTIQEEIEALHVYDLPEIIMISLEEANPSYLKWMKEEIT